MTDLRDRFGELDRIVVPVLEDELRRPRIQTHPCGVKKLDRGGESRTGWKD
jgi:hypothetical protein